MPSLRENCGVFGVWDVPEAAHLTYLGLFALQHRGQEGAGIICSDHGRFQGHRGQGLVSSVFSKEILSGFTGERAIGHVRYSTAGGSVSKNLQPLWAESSNGDIAISHNGNLTNSIQLREELEAEGCVFQSYVDTEVILHLMARAKGSARDKVMAALTRIEGAFSLMIMLRDGGKTRMFACKDPNGFRPLAMAKKGKGYIFASESCAFDLVEAEYQRELEAGELIEISREEGLQSSIYSKRVSPRPCLFEWIYFSRPDSKSFSQSVYQMRKKMGAQLAVADQEKGLKADMVIGVPDSGIPAALGYSQTAGLPFEYGLIRNHYIGRSFIEPHQSIRDFKVKIKQNPLPENLQGKEIIVIDDSIVRGTTSRKIIGLLRSAGAKTIHMRVAAPPTKSPCYYGVDTPSKKELIAAQKSVTEICDYIQADSLEYLELPRFYQELLQQPMCDACFTENYPVKPEPAMMR